MSKPAQQNLVDDLVNKLLNARMSKDVWMIKAATREIKRNLRALNRIKSSRENSFIRELIGTAIDDVVNDLLFSILRDPDTLLSEEDQIGLVAFTASQSAGKLRKDVTDELVKKDLMAPEIEDISGFFRNNRANGFLRDLALSFIEIKNDFRLAMSLLSIGKLRQDGFFHKDLAGNDKFCKLAISRNGVLEINSVKQQLKRINKDSSLKHVSLLIRNYIRGNNDADLGYLFRACRTLKIDLGDILQQNTFLHQAALMQHIDTIKILIEYGFDPLSVDDGNQNFFMLACKTQGSRYLEKYLEVLNKLESGSRDGFKVLDLLNHKDVDGNNSFDLAVQSGLLRSVELLLDVGGINADCKKNILLTINNRDLKIFKLLLDNIDLSQDPDFLDQITRLC